MADNSNRRAGILEIAVDGKILEIAGDGVDVTGFNSLREMLKGPNGPQGYSEIPQVPTCTGKFRDSKQINNSELQNITNATIIGRLANGKSFIIEGACYASEGSISSGTAEGDFKFEGMSGRWF